MIKTYFGLFFLACTTLFAQPAATTAAQVEQALKAQEALTATSRVKALPFRNIGPSVMSGRVVALAVNPEDPTEFYTAYASGGLWHTRDNGISFTPIMDQAPTQNIGEIAMHWPTRTLWVGTGENNASRSSYAGVGLYKTTDNGKSWEHKGLTDSHHIGKILINPNDPNHVVVGVTGHLYTPNAQRGVYVTTNGGTSWEHTLFVNERTGIIDMASAPGNFHVQFATAWQKDRKAWNFEGAGSASAIYKSTDAGQTWERITTAESGFPTGAGVGRIGLAVFDENTIYAIHDNQFRRPNEKEEEKEGLAKADFKSMSVRDFLELDNTLLNDFLKENGFQEKYRAQNVKNMVRDGRVNPKDVATYLEDANALLFDTPVIGAEVYKSSDGGASWAKTHDDFLDAVYFSYGYYFGHIHVAPFDADKIYIYGVPILTSDDGGKRFYSIGNSVVHSDHHALWINPNRPGHLIDGNDGGVNITYDDGKHWMKNNSPAVGQFYAITVDHEKPYNVYGGLQDNGVWKGAHNAPDNTRWHASGHNNWTEIMGGDGMYVQVDRRDSNTVYTGFQFGNYYRLQLAEKQSKRIQPKHILGETPYRFNWQTPIVLSEHNQDILYFGSNKLHRSLNQGDDWETISTDLTTGGQKGNVAYGTLTTLSESPFKFGMLYTGSDDGLVYRTDNGGGQWELISKSFPEKLWVSRVVASAHKQGRVYVTLNGYRWDDFTPYVYKSEDKGKTWTAIRSNLPDSPINVIREDPENENVLYLGNDHGVYISFDKGGHWEPFSKGLTAAAVHDLVVQPEARDLVVGTHGRSIYILDIEAIQKATPELLDKALHLFELKKMRHSKYWGQKRSPWRKANSPEMTATVYAKEKSDFTTEVKNKDGLVLHTAKGTFDAGFNLWNYDLSMDTAGQKAYNKRYKKDPLEAAENGVIYLPKGAYTIEVSIQGTNQKRMLTLK